MALFVFVKNSKTNNIKWKGGFGNLFHAKGSGLV